ncbi:aspartokinase [Vibrio maritimus]|uniref:Aspartokinase n=1 Tax=Vibrio maritimus TaxID=990268 RepID=A0A090U583_9VIBR|nr:aspartokinase [Vibrio maritimus]
MRVLKFGGSSLADADRFLRAADIIANNAQQEDLAWCYQHQVKQPTN